METEFWERAELLLATRTSVQWRHKVGIVMTKKERDAAIREAIDFARLNTGEARLDGLSRILAILLLERG